MSGAAHSVGHHPTTSGIAIVVGAEPESTVDRVVRRSTRLVRESTDMVGMECDGSRGRWSIGNVSMREIERMDNSLVPRWALTDLRAVRMQRKSNESVLWVEIDGLQYAEKRQVEYGRGEDGEGQESEGERERERWLVAKRILRKPRIAQRQGGW